MLVDSINLTKASCNNPVHITLLVIQAVLPIGTVIYCLKIRSYLAKLNKVNLDCITNNMSVILLDEICAGFAKFWHVFLNQYINLVLKNI